MTTFKSYLIRMNSLASAIHAAQYQAKEQDDFENALAEAAERISLQFTTGFLRGRSV